MKMSKIRDKFWDAVDLGWEQIDKVKAIKRRANIKDRVSRIETKDELIDYQQTGMLYLFIAGMLNILIIEFGLLKLFGTIIFILLYYFTTRTVNKMKKSIMVE